MAFDERLAARIRDTLGRRKGVVEKWIQVATKFAGGLPAK